MSNDKTPVVARVPLRKFYGSAMQMLISSLYLQRERQNQILDEEGYIGRRVLGYKLPVWQRTEKWTDQQCERFIESIFLGVGLGTFMVNFRSNGDNDCHMVLLDGQQRLRAIERYWNGELPVRGEDGRSYFWSDLTPNEHNHFFRIMFAYVESNYTTEDQMKDAYNRHNFGGTAHEESERA